MKKEWRTIKHFKQVVDDMYQVSYEGEVRYKKSKKIIKQKIANKKHHPYKAVYILHTDGKKRWVLVHQLVATYFVKIPKKYKNCKEELVPDHLDNDGTNNLYTNLEWKTRGENIKAAFERGEISNKLENHSDAIITNKQAHKICKLLEEGKAYDEIFTILKFPINDKDRYRKVLVRIKNRLAWTDISNNYHFNEKAYQYTPTQLETISYIPDIQKYIEEGKTNTEIVRLIWGNDLSYSKLQSKVQTVRKIRNKQIFKDFL